MKTIIIASTNKNKVDQIKNAVSSLDLGIELKSTADINITEEPYENGKTYAENALIKARYIFSKIGLPSIADDSGFELEALNGFPGIVSARFAKACGSYKQAFKIMDKCLGENRNASFCTTLAFIYKRNNKIIEKTFEGKIFGKFVYPSRGSYGFAYCPCFKPNGYKQTFGQMSNDFRMSINNRSIALNKFCDFLRSL